MTAPPVVAADPLANLSPTMRWLVERAKPDEPALELVAEHPTPEDLYTTWMREQHLTSAIRLVAGVLPARESIWWAWVSARYATQAPGGAPATAETHRALAAVERWIVRPDDDARRAVWDSGNEAGLGTPIGLVAAAVFLSGTSVAPPGTPPVPPPPGAVMPLVAGAITVAGSSNSKPEHIPPTLVAFATQGLEIVKRLGGWDAALKLAHDTHARVEAEYQRATAAPPAK